MPPSAPSSPPQIPLTIAALIASRGLTHHPSVIPQRIIQTRHRIRLLNSWSAIGPGSRVLEIGCGQGLCTAVLAHAVGASSDDSCESLADGHVDALDPASPDDGVPVSLGQAQARLSSSVFGSRISWHRLPGSEFSSLPPTASSRGRGGGRDDSHSDSHGHDDSAAATASWDVAVLAHSIWCLDGPEDLEDLLCRLRGRVGAVCLAEYALRAGGGGCSTRGSAIPHVLATVARGAVQAHGGSDYVQDVCTALSPRTVKEAAAKAGWSIQTEEIISPEAGLANGYWETSSVVHANFVAQVRAAPLDEHIKAAVLSARDATVASVDDIGGLEMVQTMDVWVAKLVEAAEKPCAKK